MAIKRKDVAESDKWNVEALFESMDVWDRAFADFQKANENFTTLLAYKGRLGESSETLKNFLDAYFETSRELEKLYVYAHLRSDEDQADERCKIANSSVMQFFHTFSAATSWVEPEILHLDEAKLKEFLQAKELEGYHFYLEKLANLKPHTLSASEEGIMAYAAQPLGSVSQAYSSFGCVDAKFPPAKDAKGEEKEVTQALYGLYQQSTDRTLRENSFASIHGTFRGFQNTLTELLNGCVQKHLFNMRARGYKSCVEAALFHNQIDVGVYRTLIDTVRANFKPLHDYISLRKEILGVDKVRPFDMNAPLSGDFKKEYTYDEAIGHCIDAVAPLGAEYQETLKKGLNEERWSDRYENEGKRTGAYSSGCYDSYPYILMNFKGTHNDMSTLIHEAGHSMHSHYSAKSQPYHYAGYSIFLAEVASTFNEELLFRHLLEKAESKEEKFYLINDQINSIRNTLFRQTMFAEFELRIHEMAEQGIPLTPGQLSDIYLTLNKEYYGPDYEPDENVAHEYLRIPHFYYNFYVYQYSTGISAAHALVKNVLEKGMLKEYIGYLSAGASDYPLHVLKKAGVDMLTPEPTQLLIATFGELTEQLRNCK